MGATSKIHFIKNGIWETHDFNALYGSLVEDVYVDHNDDIWFAANKGVIKYDHSTHQIAFSA